MVSATESPTREQEHLLLVRAAAAAGVQHLVYLSFAGAGLGWGKAERKARVGELPECVGLSPAQYQNCYPHELTGGEPQRVGILRAIAAKPDIC